MMGCVVRRSVRERSPRGGEAVGAREGPGEGEARAGFVGGGDLSGDRARLRPSQSDADREGTARDVVKDGERGIEARRREGGRDLELIGRQRREAEGGQQRRASARV